MFDESLLPGERCYVSMVSRVLFGMTQRQTDVQSLWPDEQTMTDDMSKMEMTKGVECPQ